MQTNDFTETVWAFYAQNSRDTLPWRIPETDGTFSPYKIMVSEVMLQQTQVSRVVEKYNQWILRFPDIRALANASLAEVLEEWLGLGYNRRARYLHTAAQVLAQQYGGIFPHTITGLVELPGIGKNTAGAIITYAYNEPVVFIETNIRTVYLHHFFTDQDNVSDKDIYTLVENTVDTEHPREWYWALMDYGSYLKKEYANPSRRSSQYKKQSKFEGSNRQVRARILHVLNSGPKSRKQLIQAIDDDRSVRLIDDLINEGFVAKAGDQYMITGTKLV